MCALVDYYQLDYSLSVLTGEKLYGSMAEVFGIFPLLSFLSYYNIGVYLFQIII